MTKTLLQAGSPEWMADALCVGRWEDFDGDNPDTRRDALEMCGWCPVRLECEGHVVLWELGQSRRDRVTVRAGLSAAERAKREKNSPHCLGCGTETGGGACQSCRQEGLQRRYINDAPRGQPEPGQE